MIGVLPGSIKAADALGQQCLNLSLQLTLVAGIECFLNGNNRSLRHHGIQMTQNLLIVYIGDFSVGKSAMAEVIPADRSFRFYDLEIAGYKQETVNRRWIVLQLWINDAGIHISRNGFPLQKICQLCIDIFVSLLQNFGNDIIVAGG